MASPEPFESATRGVEYLDSRPLKSNDSATSDQPRELDIPSLALIDPARPQMLLPTLGALPLGEPALLAGDGGAGKSNVALYMAVCAATGVSFFGEPIDRCTAAYVSFEDPEKVLHWRLRRACYAANVSMQDVARDLRILDGTKSPNGWYSRLDGGAYGFTEQFEQIRERLQGVELIVVDGAADVFAANENDRAQVKAFIRGLRTMVHPKGALLLLAHVDKNGVQQGGNGLGFSGSTGWHNSVRSRLFMYRETTDDEDGAKTETGSVVLEVRKSNYGRTGARLVLKYDDQYDIFRRVDQPADRPVSREGEEQEAIVRVIARAADAGTPIPAATSGTRTAHSVAAARDGFPASLKPRRDRPRFYRHLEHLRAAGRVVTEPMRTPSRKVIEVLNVPAL